MNTKQSYFLIVVSAVVCGMNATQVSMSSLDKQLLQATKYQELDEVNKLIAAGASVNTKDDEGNTPLMIASRHDFRPIAKALIRAHADVNMQDKGGNTALMQATMFGYTGMNKLLLSAGANMSIENREGKTAMYYAKNYPKLKKIFDEMVAAQKVVSREQTEKSAKNL